MDCTKCNHEMSWLRLEIWHKKIYYCKTCGYNFKRTLTGKVIEDPLYAIGTTGEFPRVLIFDKKESYERFVEGHEEFVFIPLKNSTNIKREYDENN